MTYVVVVFDDLWTCWTRTLLIARGNGRPVFDDARPTLMLTEYTLSSSETDRVFIYPPISHYHSLLFQLPNLHATVKQEGCPGTGLQ